MITQIDVMSEDAFALPILGVTPKSSLLIRKIDGLTPPDKTLFIGSYAQDGGLYQGRRVLNRNVVVTLDLNPNPALGETVSSLRDKLYRAFNDPQPEGDHLKMVFHEDTSRETYLVGYAEKFTSDIFSSDTLCQISMICPDPYIRDNTDTILVQPTGWVQVPFTYQGSAETGFVVRIYVTAPTTAITLYNNGKVMQFVNPSGYAIDDVIVVSTIRGARSLTLTHAAAITSTPLEFTPPTGYSTNNIVFYGEGLWKALNDNMAGGTTSYDAPSDANANWQFISVPAVSQLQASSQWLELHSADNTMRVYEGSNPESIVANIKYLKYTSSYWGL